MFSDPICATRDMTLRSTSLAIFQLEAADILLTNQMQLVNH